MFYTSNHWFFEGWNCSGWTEIFKCLFSIVPLSRLSLFCVTYQLFTCGSSLPRRSTHSYLHTFKQPLHTHKSPEAN